MSPFFVVSVDGARCSVSLQAERRQPRDYRISPADVREFALCWGAWVLADINPDSNTATFGRPHQAQEDWGKAQ